MNGIKLAWEITAHVSIIGVMIITGFCFYYFVRPYLQSKKTAVHVGIVYLIVVLIFYIIPLQFQNFVAYTISILAACIVMYVEERRNVEQKIFLGATFFSIRWLSCGMANKIYSILVNAILMREDIAERPWLQFGIYVGLNVLHISIIFSFIMISIYLLNKSFDYKKADMTRKELLMLIMPSLSAITEYGMLKCYENMYEHETGKSMLFTYGINEHFSFWHYLISITSILVMAIVFQNLKTVQLESTGQKLLQSQITDMKKHFSEVERLYQDIRLMRHDMGNHIQTIEHLLDKNEKKEAVEYAARLRQEWQDITFDIKTGNPVTDVILLEKKKEAEERGIKFLCDFHYPEGMNVDAFDVSVILNNALDNSLESVNGDLPYINISSYRKNNIFMIVISNRFEGTVEIDDDTGLPISTKKGFGHGLGLANIRRVAQMYLGDIAFEQEEGEIVLTAMLQLESIPPQE